MIDLIVKNKDNNKKIVNVLLSSFPNLTSSTVFKALRKKDILVNGKRIKENINVFENDRITAYIADSLLLAKKRQLNIVYEDENIIVVHKPSGIAVTEDANNEQNLASLVKNYCNTAMPCHRLDRNTEGLVVFAKNQPSLEILLDKFKSRQIDKYYICLVTGIPYPQNQTLVSYLFKDNKKSMVYISDTPKKGYQKVITSYKLLQANKQANISLLEVKLETGRTHQIRAHLAHIGHPIIGDGKYGINAINKQFKAKSQLLLSYKLQFNFKNDAGILNYLQNKTIEIDYSNYKKIIDNKMRKSQRQ